MSEPLGLRRLREELIELAERIVPSTATVTGHSRDFSSFSGSAWIYDDYHMVTNFHVVDGLEAPIQASPSGGRGVPVKVAGSDPLTDISVLTLAEPIATPLRVRDSDAILGEPCFAFGNPLGEFPETMTSGIVSGLGRSIDSPGGRTIEDALQIDAAINHGNSGGPLVDVEGLVLGINSAGVDTADNIGFAIPASTVRLVVPEILEYGSVERASLGLRVATRDVDLDGQRQSRLAVSALGSRAAGPFEPDDVILRIDGSDVYRRGDLFRCLGRGLVGKPVAVEVWRQGKPARFECKPHRLG